MLQIKRHQERDANEKIRLSNKEYPGYQETVESYLQRLRENKFELSFHTHSNQHAQVGIKYKYLSDIQGFIM